MALSQLSFEGLGTALTTDCSRLVLSAAGFGILSHLSIFRTLPVEEYLLKLLGLYLATFFVIGTVYKLSTDFSSLAILLRLSLISSAFNIGLASSIAVYRLFFHRLHRFPGPWLSKLSRFYDTYLAGKNVQYNVEIEMMHKTYGDFIRTGKLPC